MRPLLLSGESPAAERKPGSIGQIYNIATDARILGWKQIVIVDPLSREQLTGNHRPGRSRETSVVYVRINGPIGDCIYPEVCWEMNFMARRMQIKSAQESLRKQKGGIQCPLKGAYRACASVWRLFRSSNTPLGPLKPIYDKTVRSTNAPNEADRAINEVVFLRPPLALEVARQLTAYVRQEVDLRKLTTAPATLHRNSKRLNIHLLVSMESTELDSLRATYTKRLRNSGKQA